MTQGLVLEVRVGVGDPASIALLPGTPLDPTSFGRSAMWRIVADGVLEVHGYVYFDGQAVYVQSAEEQSPVFVNRHRVGTAWTEIRAPSTMVVGRAQIDLKSTNALARSGAAVALKAQFRSQPVTAIAPEPPRGPWDASTIAPVEAFNDPEPRLGPTPAGGSSAPFGRGAFVSRDDESTRFAPIGGGYADVGPPVPIAAVSSNAPSPRAPAPLPMPSAPVTPAPPPVSSGALPPLPAPPSPRLGAESFLQDTRAPSSLGSQPRVTSPMTSPSIPAPFPLVPTAARIQVPRGSLFDRVKADWYATSLPKRVLFVLSPFVVLSYFKFLFHDRTAETEAENAIPAATESAAPPPVDASTRAAPVQTQQPVLVPQPTIAPTVAPTPLPGQPGFVPVQPQQQPGFVPMQPQAQPNFVPAQPQGVPGQPGQFPGQVPGQQPGQAAGQFPAQVGGQIPGQVPGQQMPGQFQGQVPGQVPGQAPQQPPQFVPAQPGAGSNANAQITLERAAANALAEGNMPLALQLYERLARERPDNPAFADTARMIRERMAMGR